MAALVFVFIAGLTIMFSGSSDGLAFGFLLAGGSGAILGYFLYKDAQVTKMKKSKDIEVKNMRDGYVVLNNRIPHNQKVLFTSADRDYTITDHPAELVYTSATVGGITTGGFHVNEAYKTESVGGKTGTYHIVLRGYPNDTIVRKVLIQPDMIYSAKNHPVVKEFLNGSTLILKHNISPKIPEAVKNAAMKCNETGQYDKAAKLLRPYNSVCKLTKDECEAVIAWMSGTGN